MTRWLAHHLIQLAPRERALLGLLLLVVLPVAFIALVLTPMQTKIAAQNAQISEARALLDWLGETARTYVPRDEAEDTTDTALRPITSAADLERSLVEAGLQAQVSRLSAQGQNRISLGFDSVAFEPVMAWLSALSASGLHIAELRLFRTDAPGLVKLDLALEPRS